MNDLTCLTNPTRLFHAPLRELLADHEMHEAVLVRARHGLSHETTGRVRCAAVAALATGQMLVERLQAARCTTAADALAYGASLDHVAAALDLRPREVAAGL